MLRYLRPESAINVTILASGPSRAAIGIAATTLAPEEVPANGASSRAIRRAISFASSVATAPTWSTSAGAQSGGV